MNIILIVIALCLCVLCNCDQLDNVLNCIRGVKGGNINTKVVTGRDGNRYLLIPASSSIGTKGGTTLDQRLGTPSGAPHSSLPSTDGTSPVSPRIPMSPSRAAALSPQIRGTPFPSTRFPLPSSTRRLPPAGAAPSRQLPIPGWGMPSGGGIVGGGGGAPPLASVAKGMPLRPTPDSLRPAPQLLPRVDSSWWDRLRDGSVSTVAPQIAAPLVSNNTLYNMWQLFLDSSPPTKTASGGIAPLSNDKLLNAWPDFQWNQLRPELLAELPSLTRDGLNRMWNQFLQNQPETSVSASTPEETFERLNKLWQTFQSDVLTAQQRMKSDEQPTKTSPGKRTVVNEPLFRIWSEFADQRKAQNNGVANNDDLNRWWLELLWSQQRPQLTAAYPGLSPDKLYKLWLSYLLNEPEVNLAVDPPEIAYERLYGRWARFLRFLQSNAKQLDITQPITQQQQQRDDDPSTKGGTKARRLPNEWLYRLWQRFSNKQRADSVSGGHPVDSDDIYNWWPQFAWTYQRPQLTAINPSLTDDRLRSLWNRYLASQPKIDLANASPEDTYERLYKLWSKFQGTLQDSGDDDIVQQSKDDDGMMDVSNDPVYRSWQEFSDRERGKSSEPLTSDQVSNMWSQFLWNQEEPQLTTAYPWMTGDVMRSVWNDFMATQPQMPDLASGSPEQMYENLNQLWSQFSSYLQDNSAPIAQRYADVGTPVAQVRQQNTFDEMSEEAESRRSGEAVVLAMDNEVLKESSVNVTEKPVTENENYGLYEFIDTRGNKRMIKYVSNGNDTARAIMYDKHDDASGGGVDDKNVDDVIFGRV